MSKFLFIYHKKKKNLSKEILSLCQNITPDNLEPVNPLVISDGNGTSFGIYNPNDTNLVKDTSLCLGHTYSQNWFDIGNNSLDGNFAVVRTDSNTIELISDVVASRTIWYFYNEEFFIASSSQRLIISYLGNFQLNDEAISWMLATGSLGYGLSWDSRIKCLPADSRLVFDKTKWQSNLIENEIIFEPSKESRSKTRKKLKNVINNSISKLNIDFDKWALPLSGGYDSRGILLNIENYQQLNTVTWGLKASLHEVGSDAYIAKKIAEKMSIKHDYFHTDFSSDSIESMAQADNVHERRPD